VNHHPGTANGISTFSDESMTAGNLPAWQYPEVRDRIDYTILYVSDLERAAAFFRDVVGLPFKFSDRGYAESRQPT
jgi:hypothetical protein